MGFLSSSLHPPPHAEEFHFLLRSFVRSFVRSSLSELTTPPTPKYRGQPLGNIGNRKGERTQERKKWLRILTGGIYYSLSTRFLLCCCCCGGGIIKKNWNCGRQYITYCPDNSFFPSPRHLIYESTFSEQIKLLILPGRLFFLDFPIPRSYSTNPPNGHLLGELCCRLRECYNSFHPRTNSSQGCAFFYIKFLSLLLALTKHNYYH